MAADSTDFGKRVATFCKTQKISISAFEKRAGLANAWTSNLRAQVRLDAMEKIAEAFPDLNFNYLFTGNGPMLNCEPKTAHPESTGMFSRAAEEIIKAKDETIATQRQTIAMLEHMMEALAK